MLSATLPLVGFVIPVKKRWERGQEKKPRTLVIDPDTYYDDNFSKALSLDDLSSMASESSSENSSLADSSDGDNDSEESFLDDYTEFVTSLLPTEAIMGQPIPKLALATEEKAKKEGLTLVQKAWLRFQQWREKERERRKHYIYREYEAKVAAYDIKVEEFYLAFYPA